MKLNRIWIQDYKIFDEQLIVFEELNNNNRIAKNLYGNIDIHTLVGENGAGKSTLLGFITAVFYNLERFHNRIESNFMLDYTIDVEDMTKHIIIEKSYHNITISIDGDMFELHESRKRLSKNSEVYNSNYCEYKDIKKYLPTDVIVSCFHIDRMYPSKRVHNYLGQDNVRLHKIGGSQFSGKKGLGVIRGVMELFLIGLRTTKLKEVEQLLDIRVHHEVKLHFAAFRNGDFYPIERFDEKQHKKIINDTEITKYFDNEEHLLDFVNRHISYEFWSPYITFIGRSNEVFIDLIHFLDSDIENYRILNLLDKLNIVHISELFIRKNERIIGLSEMSSGEKTFLYRIISILNDIKNGALVILDEPEVHLNEKWCKQFISVITLLFSKFNVHFLIATHSHLFINNLFKENVLILNQGNYHYPSGPTFLANPYEIYRLINDNVVQSYPESLLLKTAENCSIEDLHKLFGEVGEGFYKYMVYSTIKKRQGDNNVED